MAKKVLTTPKVGEFWKYADGTKNHIFIVLSVDTNKEIVDSDYLCIAHIYCFQTAGHFTDYPWPNYGCWEKIEVDK